MPPFELPEREPFPPCIGCGADIDSSMFPLGDWVYAQAPESGWPHLKVPPFAIVLVLARPLDPQVSMFLAGPVFAHVCPVGQQRAAQIAVVTEAEALTKKAAAGS